MITTLDVETTVQKTEDGNDDPSPYNPANRLVSVGAKLFDPTKKVNKAFPYFCLHHSEQPPTTNAKADIQAILAETTLLIGHNIKFDLSWILECGFEYDGPVYDTMITEYVLSRGVTRPLDLGECLRRRRLGDKDHTVDEYTNKGIWFDKIPWPIVEKYGRQDIDRTEALAFAQWEELGGFDYVVPILTRPYSP